MVSLGERVMAAGQRKFDVLQVAICQMFVNGDLLLSDNKQLASSSTIDG